MKASFLLSIAIICLLSLASCSINNATLVGVWKLKKTTTKCTNEFLQFDYGNAKNELDGETTYEFYDDSTFRRKTIRQKYFSNTDNISGTYLLINDTTLKLDEKIVHIADLTKKGFSIVYKKTMERLVEPIGTCDTYNYYEKTERIAIKSN